MCEEIKFIRTCPNCGKEITYARKSDYNKAVKKGSVCKSCAEKDLGVIEAFCEYIAYNNKIMYREDTKSYRISFANSIENPKFMETLDIPEHISNREGSTTIRICRREILQLLQDVITNNNLFHLKRKWNKLMIKEPSASES